MKQKAIWDANGRIVGYVDDPEGERREMEAWAQIAAAEDRAREIRARRENEARREHETAAAARRAELARWEPAVQLRDYAASGARPADAAPV